MPLAAHHSRLKLQFNCCVLCYSCEIVGYGQDLDFQYIYLLFIFMFCRLFIFVMSFCDQLAWKHGSFIGQLLLALICRYLFFNVKMKTIYVLHHSPSLILACFPMQCKLSCLLSYRKKSTLKEKNNFCIMCTVLWRKYFIYIFLIHITWQNQWNKD